MIKGIRVQVIWGVTDQGTPLIIREVITGGNVIEVLLFFFSCVVKNSYVNCYRWSYGCVCLMSIFLYEYCTGYA